MRPNGLRFSCRRIANGRHDVQRSAIPVGAQINGFLSQRARRSAANACYAATLLEGIGHAEIPADLPSEEVRDLGVSGDSFHGAGLRIAPQRM